jgi:transcriptional regulator with XRE-family HTH domain
MLADLAKKEGLSIRSLEKKMKVSDGGFYKVLRGQVTLQVRHILKILDAIEVEWQDFFVQAYPPEGTPGDPLEAKVLAILARHGIIPPGPARSEPATD